MKISLLCDSRDALDQARMLVALIEAQPRRARAKSLQPELLELNIAMGESITDAQAESVLARYRHLASPAA